MKDGTMKIAEVDQSNIQKLMWLSDQDQSSIEQTIYYKLVNEYIEIV